MARVVVVGAGPGGLATALFSARRGHEVVVVDRDPGPPDGPADVLAAWERPGVAQAAFSHYFLARSTRVVHEEAPDLLDALEAVGILPSDVRFGPGMEDDRALLARRPVYEGVMRRFVDREPGIEMHCASVRGLIAERGTAHVRGVRLDDRTEVDADLVVDAAGRRSASGRWLRDLDLPAPAVHDDPCELQYVGRHYRLRDGELFPSLDVPVVQPLPYAVILVFIGDNRTFSVATAVSSHDPLRRRLHEPDVLDRFLRAVPLTADWLDRADPIGDVRVMAGLANRRRRVVSNGAPTPTGLALVGDASHYTNPALGQGISLTFWMAQRLADAVERAPDDPSGMIRDHEAWLDEELGPRYERQVVDDAQTTRQFAAGCRGEGWLPAEDPRLQRRLAVMMLASEDEQVELVGRRVAHLLEHPSAYDAPDIAPRVDALLDHLPAGPPGEVPLPRRAFEELVGAPTDGR